MAQAYNKRLLYAPAMPCHAHCWEKRESNGGEWRRATRQLQVLHLHLLELRGQWQAARQVHAPTAGPGGFREQTGFDCLHLHHLNNLRHRLLAHPVLAHMIWLTRA